MAAVWLGRRSRREAAARQGPRSSRDGRGAAGRAALFLVSAWANVGLGAELDILVGTGFGEVVTRLLVVRLEGPVAAATAAGGHAALRLLLPSIVVAPAAMAAAPGYGGGSK